MHRGRFSSSGLPVHFLAILINKKTLIFSICYFPLFAFLVIYLNVTVILAAFSFFLFFTFYLSKNMKPVLRKTLFIKEKKKKPLLVYCLYVKYAGFSPF